MRRIPSAFTVGPHRVEVVRLSAAEMDALGEREGHGPVYGLCDYDHLRIFIRKASRSMPVSLQNHTFWHEYFHMLLHLSGRERLARDEVLVDSLASAHLQATNSFE